MKFLDILMVVGVPDKEKPPSTSAHDARIDALADVLVDVLSERHEEDEPDEETRPEDRPPPRPDVADRNYSWYTTETEDRSRPSPPGKPLPPVRSASTSEREFLQRR